MHIDLWTPSLDPTEGGIQAYSLEVFHALGRLGHHVEPIVRADSRAKFILSASRALLTRKPDLIFSTHLHFAPVAGFWHRLLRIPYVVTLHGVEAWADFSPLKKRALAGAALVLPVSEITRDRARERLLPLDCRMEILYNTFDDQRFIPGPKPPALLARHGFTESTPVILTVGRLDASDDYKGHDRIIAALPALRKQKPGLRYLIVGDGTDRPRLEALSRDLGVSEAVVFAGRVPSGELVLYYQLCDVFAMPSKGEGFGIVYLEALACGKPVIAGRGDGGRDALKHGELGQLVDPDDIDELATAIARCLDRDPSLPEKSDPVLLRQAVLRHFGHDAFRTRLEHLVEMACAAR